MHKRLLAIALIVAPVAVAAQPADNVVNPTPASGAGLYGPPAPTAGDSAHAPAATQKAAAADGAPANSKHRGHGHRRGAYLGADGGGQG